MKRTAPDSRNSGFGLLELMLAAAILVSAILTGLFALVPLARQARMRREVASANVAAQRVLKDSIQIHGGVGFTFEHDLHLYLRRATLGATQIGTTTWHLDRIAELLFDERHAPTLA